MFSLTLQTRRFFIWLMAIIFVLNFLVGAPRREDGLASPLLAAFSYASTGAFKANTPTEMLQFVSEGHIVGFQNNRVYFVALDHALRLEFVNANQVQPQTARVEGFAGDVVKAPSSPVHASRPPTFATLASSNYDPLSIGQRPPPLIRVNYPNLWPGITLTYEAKTGHIAKSTYIVAPGADPGCIRLRYNVPVVVQTDGSLGFMFETGYLTETSPLAWQNINGQTIPVPITFKSDGPTDISFAVGHYNQAYPLIIDPAYQWHTFYGSSSGDFGYGITVDADDNIYVVGHSGASWNGPNPSDTPRHAHTGSLDLVILKLDSSGNYQWHTFYGSSTIEYSRGIAVDANGNVVVTGYSNATWNGPNPADTPRHAYRGETDIVILKLDNQGDYIWHTFYGSSSYDYSRNITTDSNGNIYVAGNSNATWNGPNPTDTPQHSYRGAGDMMILKLDNSGDYLWHTFYGSVNTDYSLDIVVKNNDVVIVGHSPSSWNGPNPADTPRHAHSGSSDITVLALDNNGNYQWHTFYGGSNTDTGISIVIDSNDNIIVAGHSTATWNGPNPADTPRHAHSGGSDITVLALDNNGDYQWHTFYGSSVLDYSFAIAVDSNNDIAIAGRSDASWNGADTAHLPLHPYSGDNEIVILALTGNGDYRWHTFYGNDRKDEARGIAIDSTNYVYVIGHSTNTWDGPNATPPQHSHSDNNDIVVVKTGPAPEMTLLGNQQEIVSGSLLPSTTNHTNFGSVILPGGATTHTFTISNTGEIDLVLTDTPPVFLTDPGHFDVTLQPVSPVFGDTSTTFEIRFIPTTTGMHTATVRIANNDPDETPYTFVIQGMGLDGTYLPLILKY